MIANKKEKGKLGNIQWVLNISTTTYWRNRLWNCDHEDCLVAKNSSISISFFCCWNTIQLNNFPHPSSVKFLLSYSVKFVVALTIFESLPKPFFWTDICWWHFLEWRHAITYRIFLRGCHKVCTELFQHFRDTLDTQWRNSLHFALIFV